MKKIKLPLTELRDKKRRGSNTVDGFLIEWRGLSVIYNWFGVKAQTKRGHIRSNELTLPDKTLRNEMAHIMQQYFLGYKFMPLYLYLFCKTVLQGKNGYKDHPLERDSEALESVERGWEQVMKDSWRKYEN
jgi:hypothetical protein